MKENDQRDRNLRGDHTSGGARGHNPSTLRTDHKKNHRANPGILDWIADFFVSPIEKAIIELVPEASKIITATVPEQALAKFQPAIDKVLTQFGAATTPSSSLTPDEGWKRADDWTKAMKSWFDVYLLTAIGLEISTAGLLDVSPSMILQAPHIRAFLSTSQDLFIKTFDAIVGAPFQRYLNREHTPLLPGYQDMISVYVREGYMEEKWVEIPEEFAGFMKELGYSEDWTKRLWGQHWVLPGVNLLYEMFHKKIITYDAMVAMLKYHDFEPVWRDRLIQNAYALIPRVDLRRGYAWGIYSGEQLQERYEKLGYSPADASSMTDIAKRFGLSAYYSRLLTVACATFRKGLLPGPDFQNIMEVCGLPQDAQDLLLDAETMARDAAVTEPGEEPRTLSASQVCSSFAKGLLSLSAAKDRLLDMGYLEGDADLLLALAAPKPAAEEPSTEIVSAASLLYRNGWMSPEEFDGWLRKAKLSDQEIQVTKDAQDLRFWFDYASDLLALWKQMYAKDLITWGDFYTNLLKWGCQPDRAMAIVSLEETRKIPKPKPAG